MAFINSFFFTLVLVLVPALSYGLTVTNTDDSGPGSLRQAIADTPVGGTVDFAVDGIITLGSEILIDKSLNIEGPGADQLTISGGDVTRILQILINPSNNVSISGLRFADGNANNGGAIFYNFTMSDSVNPSLIIDQCLFENNTAVNGGAMDFFTFINANLDTVPVTISNSTFRGNNATQRGGAISLQPQATVLEIFNSTFESNTAASGGAIAGDIAQNILKIYNNTFDSNIATCNFVNCINPNGGALTLSLKVFPQFYDEVYFNTFNNNRVICNVGTCLSTGGASIHYAGADMPEFDNTTIMSNIFNSSDSTDECAILNPTIGDYDNTNGMLVSLGYNISNDETCATGGPGDRPNTNPELDPEGLKYNGGYTQTIALFPTSPAIDIGNPNCPPPDNDQRGISRPQGSSCDSGAYEFQEIIRPIPTLSEWGLLAMALILGLTAYLALHRKIIMSRKL